MSTYQRVVLFDKEFAYARKNAVHFRDRRAVVRDRNAGSFGEAVALFYFALGYHTSAALNDQAVGRKV